MPVRFLAVGLLATVLAACGTVASLGQGAVRGVNRAGESVAGRLTASDKPEIKAELPELTGSITVEVVSEHRITDGMPDGYPKPWPAFDDEVVYTLGESRRHLFAHALADGKRLWKAGLEDDITGGVGVGDDLVLVGTANGELIALAATDGKERWRVPLESEILAPPTARDGVVVVATGDGHLYGLGSADGARKWSIEREVPTLSLRGGSAPLTTPTLALHGFADGHLVAVDLHTGREAWDTPIVQPRGRTELERMVDADCQPVIEGGAVFAGAYQGRASGIELATGTVGWARELSCDTALAADSFNVYGVDTDDRISAFDQRSGAVYWEQDALKGRHLTAPAVVGSYLAVADIEGYVHWLRADDGTLVGRTRPTKDAFLLPPYVRDGVAYFLSEGGRLYALRPAN
ncbi:MAG: outer membrane protein assembly factor BamB [Gammaproteobacteria bacterium]